MDEGEARGPSAEARGLSAVSEDGATPEALVAHYKVVIREYPVLLADLRRVALDVRAAVPWMLSYDGKSVMEEWDDEAPVVCRRPGKAWRGGWAETASYIALANPALVVAIIEELVAAREVVKGHAVSDGARPDAS